MNVLTDNLSNGFNNTVLPFDFRVNTSTGGGFQLGVPSGNLVAGNVQVVLLEVLLAKLIRMGLRMDRVSLGKLVLIHAISLPLTGGIVGFVDPVKPLKTNPDLQTAFMDGAKNVPALFLAQYITNTAVQGLHTPKISMSDILITAACRIITRPMLKYVYQYAPVQVQDNFDANDEMVGNQQIASRFKTK